MKALSAMIVAMSLSSGFLLMGCEVSHTETDKPRLLGGNTHEETTTTRNPVTGETSTSHSEEKTR